jgi:hypothetical protein
MDISQTTRTDSHHLIADETAGDEPPHERMTIQEVSL